MADRAHTSIQATAQSLPEFQNPPINEVVCGVQFEALEKWQTVHFGLFWQRVQQEYPNFSDHQPLVVLPDPMKPPAGVGIAVQGDLVPLRRVWMVDQTGRYLMQVDPPRFLHNWRKVKDTDSYPRFQAAYPRFTKSLELFRSFARDSSLGETRPNQYELSYINHIFADELGKFPQAVNKFVTFYTWQSAFLAEPTAAAIQLTIPMPRSRGNLSVSIKHGIRGSDQREVLLLELTARGSADPSGSDMTEWFELAHETIVRGFAEVTTTEAHKMWGRKA